MNKYKSFITWARRALPQLSITNAEEASEIIMNKLNKINTEIGIEVSELKTEDMTNNRELIFTAFSDKSLFSTIDSIVSRLNNIEGWDAIALKPERGFSFKLKFKNISINANQLRFSIADQKNKEIILFLPFPIGNIDETELSELAWLILETGLGERLSSKIESLELDDSTESQKGTDITQLKNVCLTF